MSIPQLMVANCPRCGKVFQKNIRNLCTACSGELDSALTQCLGFLQKNRKSTCEQVSAETGVPSEQIIVWIKEGKMLLSDYPNLNYPCSSCAKPIRQHKLCPDCLMRLNKDIRELKERQKNSGCFS